MKKDRLEMFWVMSDALTSSDRAERRRALLVLWALFYDVYGTLREPVVVPNWRELRKLGVAVWDQLKASGFLTSRRRAELLKAHEMLDMLVWVLPKSRVVDVRKTYMELNKRMQSAGVHGSNKTQIKWMSRVGEAP